MVMPSYLIIATSICFVGWASPTACGFGRRTLVGDASSPGYNKTRCTRSAARTHVKCVRDNSASPYLYSVVGNTYLFQLSSTRYFGIHLLRLALALLAGEIHEFFHRTQAELLALIDKGKRP